MYILVKKAIVHKTHKRKKKDEVLRVKADTIVLVLEEAESDGHRRARIGEDQWISLSDDKGKVLAKPCGAASEADVVIEAGD